MIQSLHIGNFLSHAYSELEFSPGVNVIIGESGVGKSAIVKSLRWVLFNRPVGEDFRSYWGGDTAVSVHTKEGVVNRYRGKDGNKYMIGLSSFNAVRTDVPDEVLDLLNMNEINLQSQFDSHFLLSQSSGEVAKFFNAVAHLDKIDIGFSSLNNSIRTLNHSISSDEGRLSELQEELVQYKDIHIIEEKIEHIEEINESINSFDSEADEIGDILNDIEAMDVNLDNYNPKTFAALDVIAKIQETREFLSKTQLEKNIICTAVQEVLDVENDIHEGEEKIKAEELIQTLENCFLSRKQLSLDKESLESSIQYLSNIERKEKIAETNLNELEVLFHKNIGEICPLCGNKVKNREARK
jgi:exonuclease SbcC